MSDRDETGPLESKGESSDEGVDPLLKAVARVPDATVSAGVVRPGGLWESLARRAPHEPHRAAPSEPPGRSARFQLLEKLGQGGMGVVYEALDTERRERVAIKMLLRADPTALLRFKHEFRALQDLEHPNLVRLGELHESGGEWFFSMELVHGTDLLSYVRGTSAPLSTMAHDVPRPPPYDEARLRACFQQLATGLRVLHGAGKVHRDIKPSNVRVTPEGRVVILDFGLVMDHATSRLSSEGAALGTAAYMAPEQGSGGAIDASADWYAFGVALYEALTGTLPFSGTNLMVLLAKLSVTPPPPRAVEPRVPADLDELCVELLRVTPAQRPRGEEVLRRLGVVNRKAAAAPQTEPPESDGALFVGRSSEFSLLEAALDGLRAGHTLTVSVEGPSGIGKSALVSRFLRPLSAATEFMVLQARCYERETTRFKALDGIIDALATTMSRLPGTERHELVPRNAALLRQLFPVLGRVDVIARAPASPAPPLDPAEERRRMFMSLRELLAKVGERKLLLLVIDDMHWADGDSLELLRALLDASHGPPPRLLLIVTARVPWLTVGGYVTPDEGWPTELRRLPVGPLAEADTLALARALLERQGVAHADAESLVRESHGHPLFVAELARHVGVSPAGGLAPLTLDAAIWERARALPEPSLRALMLLAVAAVPLPISLLELATHLAPNAFERQLSLLRLSGFVRSAAGRDVRRVEPYHDRVREAVLDRLSAAQRVELHRTLAPLLEQEPGIDPEHVAQHYLDAHEHEKAAALFARAARRAEEGFAFERAAQLYQKQLDIQKLSPAEHSDIHRKIGAALGRAGLARAAADAYLSALEGADALSSVQLRYLAASHLLRSGHVSEGLAQLELVLSGVGLRAPTSRAQAIAAFVWQRLRLFFQRYQTPFREEGQIAPNMLARADALASVSQGLGWVDGVRAAPLAAQALRAALAAGERGRIARALGGEAIFLSMKGRAHARGIAQTMSLMHAAAAGTTNPQLLASVSIVEAAVACNTCDFRVCLTKANEALALLDNPGLEAQWERTSARIYRMYGYVYLGHLRELVEDSVAAAAEADARRDRLLASILRLSAGYTTLRLGLTDMAGARAQLEEGYAPWREREPGFMHTTWLIQGLMLDFFCGKGDQALERLRNEQPALRRAGVMHVEILRSLFEFYAANAHLLVARQHGKGASLEQALVHAKRVDSDCAFYAGLARLVRAQVAWARTEPERALQLACEAEVAFQTGGAGAFAVAATWLKGRLLGGDEGARLCLSAELSFRAEAVSEPAMYMLAHAPYALP